MNIVSMAAQFLTPALIERLAGSLGITSPLAQKAIAAILPAIFGGIIGKASNPSGLEALGKILGQTDTGLLGNLGSILGGSGQAALAKSGTDILGSLLGGNVAGALGGAAAKFAGIGEAPAKSLLGVLAPVALGAIAQQKAAQHLDMGGLAKMLMGQKDNIAAAMPVGFADALKGAGLGDAFLPTAAQPAAAPRPARAEPMPHVRPATASAPPARASGSWLPIALAAAVAALGAWYFLGRSAPSVVTMPKPPAITVGTQDIGARLGTAAEGLRTALAGLKDEASAKSALPRLQETAKSLDDLDGLRKDMPPAAKQSLAAYATTLLVTLRPMIENALKAAGVGAIAKPVLDQIQAKLEALAKA